MDGASDKIRACDFWRCDSSGAFLGFSAALESSLTKVSLYRLSCSGTAERRSWGATKLEDNMTSHVSFLWRGGEYLKIQKKTTKCPVVVGFLHKVFDVKGND